MISIETLKKRAVNKEVQIAKLEKKLSRIRLAEASGWETNNPYGYMEYDLKSTLHELDSAQKALDKLYENIRVAEMKEKSRNVPAILEFLDQWKQHCLDFYTKGIKEYYDAKQNLRQLYKEYNDLPYGSEEYDIGEAAYKAAWQAYKDRKDEFKYVATYTAEPTFEAAIERLKKALDQEANAKYDFIIERTTAIVGEIQDASQLSIGSKGDLNGYIIGTNGTASVQTIGAGGYNIQCYHFRTLIRKVN